MPGDQGALPCSRCAAQLHPQARRGETLLCTRTMQWVPPRTVISRITAFPASPGSGERKPSKARKKFLVALKKIMQIFRQMLTYLKLEKQIAYSTPNRRSLRCSLLAKGQARDAPATRQNLQHHFQPACTATSVAVTYMKPVTAKNEYI